MTLMVYIFEMTPSDLNEKSKDFKTLEKVK